MFASIYKHPLFPFAVASLAAIPVLFAVHPATRPQRFVIENQTTTTVEIGVSTQEARAGVTGLAVDPTNVVYRREAGATPPMPPCSRRVL